MVPPCGPGGTGERCADDAGARPEFARPEPDAAQVRRQLAMQRLKDHRLEHVERSGDAAGDDDGLRVEQGHGARECGAQGACRRLQRAAGDGLTLAGGVDKGAAARALRADRRLVARVWLRENGARPEDSLF